jgi:hypothetical protein
MHNHITKVNLENVYFRRCLLMTQGKHGIPGQGGPGSFFPFVTVILYTA